MYQIQQPKTSNTSGSEVTRPAFLLILAGGAGKLAGQTLIKHYDAAHRPFPLYSVAIDTDPTGFEGFNDFLNIAPTREEVTAMANNPSRYGPACQAILEHHPDLLSPQTLGMGSRTSRIITQVAFELKETQIVNTLQRSVQKLMPQGNCEKIMPVVLASTGGGTGSAAIVLLLDILHHPVKKGKIMLGMPPGMLDDPTAFLIDAYAHALQQHNEVAPDWIMGNSYATRVELAEYEKQGKGFYYCFHLGLGNDAGAVFASITEICEANGLIAWQWMNSYEIFKGRAVDGLDTYMRACRYHGQDTPEKFIPNEYHPPFADKI